MTKIIPLYEEIIKDIKKEMNKSSWIRDILLIKTLKSLQSKFAKYWRKTGNFPSDEVAHSLVIDEIKLRQIKIESSDIVKEIEILKRYLRDNIEYINVDLDTVSYSKTNVKWPLIHNPKNIIITDKRQLRNIQ